MKRITKTIILLISIFIYMPNLFALKTDTYANANLYANKYILNKTEYTKYIVNETGIKYGLSDTGVISLDTTFTAGGFLNNYEYNVSGGKKSYLYGGPSYFTMTKYSSQVYQISTSGSSLIAQTTPSGAKITEYIKSKTKVTGKGTKEDPWEFVYANNTHTLSVILNGGTFNGSTVSPVVINDIDEETVWNLTPTPTKSCSIFNNITLDTCTGCSVNGTSITIGSTDVTATVNWKTTFTVTLNKMNGTGGTDSFDMTICTPTLPASITVPTRAGYTFQGYFSGTNGTGTRYFNANGTRAITTAPSNQTMIYANWTANNYTVYLDKRDGSSFTVTATYGSALPTTSAHIASRSGYSFYGYYTGTGCTGTQYVSNTGSGYYWYLTTNGTRLYACFRNNVTVTVTNGYYSGTPPQRTYEGTNYSGGVYVYGNSGTSFSSVSGTGCSYSGNYLSIASNATACTVNFGASLASRVRRGDYVYHTVTGVGGVSGNLWRVWSVDGSNVSILPADVALDSIQGSLSTLQQYAQRYCNGSPLSNNCSTYGTYGYKTLEYNDLCNEARICSNGTASYQVSASPDNDFWFASSFFWLGASTHSCGPYSQSCVWGRGQSWSTSGASPTILEMTLADGAGNPSYHYHRPIIWLKSTVSITSGSGTSGDPYRIA